MKKLLIIILNLFSKQKTVLLTDFYEKVEKIAKENDENYFHVSIELSSNHGEGKEYRFTSYVNGFNHSSGLTIKESVDGLLSQKEEKENKDFAVII